MPPIRYTERERETCDPQQPPQRPHPPRCGHTHQSSKTHTHTHPPRITHDHAYHTHTPQPSGHAHLLHVDLEGPVRLALWAGASLHLLVLALVEGPQDVATLEAVVLDHAELREDPRAAGHHSVRADQLVQVQLPAKGGGVGGGGGFGEGRGQSAKVKVQHGGACWSQKVLGSKCKGQSAR